MLKQDFQNQSHCVKTEISYCSVPKLLIYLSSYTDHGNACCGFLHGTNCFRIWELNL